MARKILKVKVQELEGAHYDLVAVAATLDARGETYLLYEQTAGGSLARYVFLFYRPLVRIVIRRGTLKIITGGQTRTIRGNPLENLRTMLRAYRIASTTPAHLRYAASIAGYLGYDCAQYLEPITLPQGSSAEDEASLAIFERVYVLDRQSGTLTAAVVFLGRSADVSLCFNEMQGQLAHFKNRNDAPLEPSQKAPSVLGKTDPRPKDFEHKVSRIQQHIKKGDIFQCVLSSQTIFRGHVPPLRVYDALRRNNPSPFHYCFVTPEQTLVGASPEPLVCVRGRSMETFPIAGTAPRGKNTAADRQRESSLLRDSKERSEHLMLVDLSRNDLGRVSRPGSVRVAEFAKVQRFAHVMHLVSKVTGERKQRCSPFDALLACFPAGTLTGAPKVRAMEIIASLEPQRRGAYGGTFFLYDFEENLESCILIRTIIMVGIRIKVQAGAGIVGESVAAKESAEICHKTAGARSALGVL